MKKNLMLSLILVIVLAACKKDPPIEPSITLKGKWTVENTIKKEFENGIITNTETIPGDGTRIDFQASGNLIVSTPGDPDESTPYLIKPGSKVEFYGETYDIKTLTATNASLFIHRDLSPNEYAEVSINLKR